MGECPDRPTATPTRSPPAYTDAQLRRLSKAARRRLLDGLLDASAAWRKENALLDYVPANLDAYPVHYATAREVGLAGGSRSSKTSVLLAEFAIAATGEIPFAMRGEPGRDWWGAPWPARPYPAEKCHPGRLRARLLVSSFQNAWEANVKEKLQWWRWTGKPAQEGGIEGDPRRGHGGLIPRRGRLGGDWDRSWSQAQRRLTLNADGRSGTTPGATLQVLSQETDPQDLAQGAFHVVLEDELPDEWMHREHVVRVLDYGGRVLTGGTPSDERTTAVAHAWFYDDLYLPGVEGADPTKIYACSLWTEKNRSHTPTDLAALEAQLLKNPEAREARFHGQFLHLAGLVFPGFTARTKSWCGRCRAPVLAPAAGACPTCGTPNPAPYRHVVEDDEIPEGWPGPRDWPTVFYMDPHPSRATACLWIRVDPHEGWWVVAELDAGGNAGEVRRAAETVEAAAGLSPVTRLGDEKITMQSNQFAEKVDGEVFNIRRAFEDAGFPFEPANTNFVTARDRILAAFEPDPGTGVPRLRVSVRCPGLIYDLTHHVWAASRRSENVALREQPSRTHSDRPACLRFHAMLDPSYRGLLRLMAPAEPLRIGAGGVGRNRAVGY